jgi:hypothetical protein
VIVRSTIGTGSPQQGMIKPTSGSPPWGNGWGSGTARHQWLAMFSTLVAIVKTLATRNGQASHGRWRLSTVNSHGRYIAAAITYATPTQRISPWWRIGG